MMIKIILVEDHTVVRNGIRSLLEKVENFRIIGEAINGEEVLELLASGLEPDVLLCDLNLKGMGGSNLPKSWYRPGISLRSLSSPC